MHALGMETDEGKDCEVLEDEILGPDDRLVEVGFILVDVVWDIRAPIRTVLGVFL